MIYQSTARLVTGLLHFFPSFPRLPVRSNNPRMPDPARIRIIKHEAVPLCGSFEVRLPDGRPARYFYWDDIPGRRLRPDLVDRETAVQSAQALARAEQDKL